MTFVPERRIPEIVAWAVTGPCPGHTAPDHTAIMEGSGRAG